MNYKEHPLTEYLDFTYTEFGKPEIGETYIRLPAREFMVIKGFPGYDHDVNYLRGVLLFEGIVSSTRMIREYATPQMDSFKPPYTITDGPFAEVKDEAYLFYLGGFLYDPPGWTEWNLVAVTVQVESGEPFKSKK